MGYTFPSSWFAHAKVTSPVSSRSAASRSAVAISPRDDTGNNVTRKPPAPSASTAPRTAGCSMGDVITCRRPRAAATSARPRIARLSPSVPPDVNTISSPVAPKNRATCPRARSTASRARRPAAWTLDGLPSNSTDARVIASATSGRTGLVAL